MLAQSLTTRSVHFAFLFGPPRTLGRQEASRVYESVCDRLRIDDFAFQYENAKESPHSQGFKIRLERKEGRGAFGVTIDNPSIQQPVRLLLEYTWPPSLEHVYDHFDVAATAVFATLEGEWQKVLAEVRLRAQCADRNRDALKFLREEVLKVAPEWIDSLGRPLAFAGCRFQTASAGPIEEPLDSPLRELSVEVLKEDASCFYFELMTQWRQVPTAVGPAPAANTGGLRQFTLPPSEYVKSEREFLHQRVSTLAELARAR